MRRIVWPLLVSVIAFSTSGCGGGVTTGETRMVSRSIDLDSATAVSVSLEMGAGELRVQGGAPKLMDANFRFNVPSWEPQVAYANDSARASLAIKQPGSSVSFGKVENTWDVRLNDAVPIALAVSIGAGAAKMTIGSMNLQRVEVRQGAGELTLDLRGAPTHGYDVRVNGGVGEAHIRVPRNVGVTASASGGLGEVTVHGLDKRGDVWVNPKHEHDAVAIHLDVKGGVGQINISVE